MADILALADELLQLILEHLALDPEASLTVDKRAYLSQESFRPPPAPSPTQSQDVGNIRLTCKKFSAIGAEQQFRRVTTRFSAKGMERLENIAKRDHLAKNVKKFSYMVPRFYTGDHQSEQALINHIRQTSRDPEEDVSVLSRKLGDQRELIHSQKDFHVLKKAIAAFVKLQHVQILRVQDRDDEKLLNLIRHQETTTWPLLELKWAPACLHSTKTICAALLASQSTCTRFSSPMLSPQSAVGLAGPPPSSFSMLAQRLTCLELHFDDGQDLDVRMFELSGLFNVFFRAAVNMEAVHVGFPSHRPLSLSLEAIFDNVQWRYLIAFGVQGWKLEADEIICFARRHKERLRGLRLRDVLLKDGSMWKDILGVLKSEMLRLEWVSLRRIGYARPFDEYWANPGIEVPDDPPGGLSDSDEDSDDGLYPDDDDLYPTDSDSNGDGGSNFPDTDSEDEGSDDEYGPAAHAIDFPSRLNSPDTPSSVPWCNCNGQRYPEDVDELGDDGTFVDNKKRKVWEKWVLGRCPEHDLEFLILFNKNVNLSCAMLYWQDLKQLAQ